MVSARKKSKSRSLTHGLRDYAFFAERSLDSPSFVSPLVIAGYTVHRFFEHVNRPDAEDAVWIRYAAERQWVSLTGDKDIGSKPDEIRDVMESGAGSSS